MERGGESSRTSTSLKGSAPEHAATTTTRLGILFTVVIFLLNRAECSCLGGASKQVIMYVMMEAFFMAAVGELVVGDRSISAVGVWGALFHVLILVTIQYVYILISLQDVNMNAENNMLLLAVMLDKRFASPIAEGFFSSLLASSLERVV